jgi:hypothetical protein
VRAVGQFIPLLLKRLRWRLAVERTRVQLPFLLRFADLIDVVDSVALFFIVGLLLLVDANFVSDTRANIHGFPYMPDQQRYIKLLMVQLQITTHILSQFDTNGVIVLRRLPKWP